MVFGFGGDELQARLSVRRSTDVNHLEASLTDQLRESLEVGGDKLQTAIGQIYVNYSSRTYGHVPEVGIVGKNCLIVHDGSPVRLEAIVSAGPLNRNRIGDTVNSHEF